MLVTVFVPLVSAVENKPNIVVFIADDLGHGDLGYTGHPHIRTPHIDRLAADGVSFQNCYAAASVCSPSRAALMTGRMPYGLGIYGFIHVGDPYVHLPPSENTLPQLVRAEGYQTALVGKWHVSLNDYRDEHPHIPSMEDYGFDYWFSSDNNTVILDKPAWWRNGKAQGKLDGYAANVVGDDSVKWLSDERQAETPFLLFVNFYEPHWFIEAPDELVSNYHPKITANRNEAIYFASVENVDRQVGRVLETLDRLELSEDTAVFFTSDHGPANPGKDRAHVRNYGTSKPYRGYKYGLWEGSVHVPGVMRWPGKVKPASTIQEPVSLIDFLPTVCAMTGTAAPNNLDGVNVLPLLQGNPIIRKKPLQWHHYNSTLMRSPNPNASLRLGDYLICGFYDADTKFKGRWIPKHMGFIRETPLKRFELYNLANDRTQQHNLAEKEPERFVRMRDELREAHQTQQRLAIDWESARPASK